MLSKSQLFDFSFLSEEVDILWIGQIKRKKGRNVNAKIIKKQDYRGIISVLNEAQ